MREKFDGVLVEFKLKLNVSNGSLARFARFMTGFAILHVAEINTAPQDDTTHGIRRSKERILQIASDGDDGALVTLQILHLEIRALGQIVYVDVFVFGTGNEETAMVGSGTRRERAFEREQRVRDLGTITHDEIGEDLAVIHDIDD